MRGIEVRIRLADVNLIRQRLVARHLHGIGPGDEIFARGTTDPAHAFGFPRLLINNTAGEDAEIGHVAMLRI